MPFLNSKTTDNMIAGILAAAATGMLMLGLTTPSHPEAAPAIWPLVVPAIFVGVAVWGAQQRNRIRGILSILVPVAVFTFVVIVATSTAVIFPDNALDVNNNAFTPSDATLLLQNGAGNIRLVLPYAWAGLAAIAAGVAWLPKR